MPLRVIIADDEPLGRERVRRWSELEPGVEIVAECADGFEALRAIRSHAPDLVFLGICMPGLDGFGVLRGLDGDCPAAIIFVTAHDTYAVRAFEVNAVDYLLKPFDRERFRQALERARDVLLTARRRRNAMQLCEQLAGLRERRRRSQRITVRATGRVFLVNVTDIDWIRGADNYAELHVGTQCQLLRQTLSALEQDLAHDGFLRISRSLLVNAERIHEVHRRGHGDFRVILHDGTRLAGSRKYRRNLRPLLDRKT